MNYSSLGPIEQSLTLKLNSPRLLLVPEAVNTMKQFFFDLWDDMSQMFARKGEKYKVVEPYMKALASIQEKYLLSDDEIKWKSLDESGADNQAAQADLLEADSETDEDEDEETETDDEDDDSDDDDTDDETSDDDSEYETDDDDDDDSSSEYETSSDEDEDDSSEEEEEEEEKESEQKPSKLLTKIFINDILIFVAEQYEDDKSKGLVVNTTCQIKMANEGNSRSTLILGVGTQAYACSDTLRMEHGSAIVKPFDFGVKYCYNPRSTSAEIDLPPITLILSFKEIRLLQYLVNYLTTPAAPAQQQQQGQPQQPKVAKGKKQAKDKKSKAVQKPQDGSKEPFVHQNLKFTFREFYFIIIDKRSSDSMSPLFCLSLSNIAARMTNWSRNLFASVVCSIYGSYYNICGWEPFIDPWRFQFRIKNSLSAKTLYVIMNAKEKLDIMVSSALLDTVAECQYLWSTLDDSSPDHEEDDDNDEKDGMADDDGDEGKLGYVSSSSSNSNIAGIPGDIARPQEDFLNMSLLEASAGARSSQSITDTLLTLKKPFYLKNDTGSEAWFWFSSKNDAPVAIPLGELIKLEDSEEDIRVHKQTTYSEDSNFIFGSIWENDISTLACRKCGVRFSTFTRRHHCRGCGQLFCEKCSKYKDYIDGKLSRLCEACFNELQKRRAKKTKMTIKGTANEHLKNLISLQIYNEEGAVKDIPMDQVGVFTFHSTKTIYEVSRYKGGFLMYLHSNMYIKNESYVSIVAMIGNKEQVIEPGARFYVPNSYKKDTKLRFKPQGDAYEWSSENLRCEDVTRVEARHNSCPSTYNLKCKPVDESDSIPFRLICSFQRASSNK